MYFFFGKIYVRYVFYNTWKGIKNIIIKKQRKNMNRHHCARRRRLAISSPLFFILHLKISSYLKAFQSC